MNKTLVTIVDRALLPAALFVVGKFVGLIITVNVFSLPWTVQEIPESFFTIRPALLSDDLIVANSYSDLIMFLLLALGFSLILIQAAFFHNSHIHPRLLVKLANNNLLGLIKSSFDLYHNAVIWLLFNWLAVFTIIINVLTQKTYLWIGGVSLITAIVFTVTLLQDVYREIEISKRNLGKQMAF